MSKNHPWLRLYVEALDDPKIQTLEPIDFKFWANMLLVARKCGGRLPPRADMAFMMRLDVAVVVASVTRLIDAQLIDKVDDCLIPHNWAVRQYESDNSGAERARNFRERRKRNKTVTLRNGNGVTPPETDTDSEQKQNPQTQNLGDLSAAGVPPTPPGEGTKPPKKKPVKIASRLPDDWQPSERNLTDAAGMGCAKPEALRQAEAFRDWALSAPGDKGLKKDWDAAWRNWIRRREEFHGSSGGPTAPPRRPQNNSAYPAFVPTPPPRPRVVAPPVAARPAPPKLPPKIVLGYATLQDVDALRHVRNFASNGGPWAAELGPTPGSPDCIIKQDILDQVDREVAAGTLRKGLAGKPLAPPIAPVPDTESFEPEPMDLN